ncbi:MAG: YbjQ family protein, partial [bacterium]
GEQKGYAKMVIESREQAMQMMIEKAQALGADAVIGVRFDSTEFDAGQGQSMNEVIAYGTAVKLSPKSS